ncbi:MAG: MATE family efflux transporter [Syntrophobacteraceae bacterium]
MLELSMADELGKGKTGGLLLQYSIPAIIGMTASSLYNVIDRIFIGQGVGAPAISGLAITLPIMNLAIAFGAMVGVGAASMVSIRLGEKKQEDATLILGNALSLNIIIGLTFSVIVLAFLDRILYAFGASSATLPYAKQFMEIILAANMMTHVYMGLNNIMRSSGYPRKAMVITLITIGINIVLAPVFIFTFKWGIRGAAMATVLSQSVGTVWVLVHFMSRRSGVHFERGCMRLNMPIIRDIISIGMSSFLVHLCACLIVILLNLKLAAYGGDFAVGAFGIIHSVLMLFAMVVIGLTQGMQPIAGYNYGARQIERVIRVFRYTVVAASCVTTAGFLIGECIPQLTARAFTDNPELIALSTTGMRITMAMFPVVGFQIVTCSLFQSIGQARIAIILSLSRQVLILIPALIILPWFFGLNGVWAAIPVADLLASVLTFFVLKAQIGKFRSGN